MDFPTKPLEHERLSEAQMRQRAAAFLATVRRRRSVREFSPDPIPLDVVQTCIESAGQAPSGANKQPWTFVLVTDPTVKAKIRQAAEEEERNFYAGRASEEWLADLAHLGTDENKPFLDIAPALIVVFAQTKPEEDGQHYYVKESVGLASGILLAALNNAGFATLTHTPSPMKFLSEVLGRPSNERPFLLIPVGYPADDCRVPDIDRKTLDEYLVQI